jgi:hypothetical protein
LGNREPLGIKLKGFKNIYLEYKNSKKNQPISENQFPELIVILEQLLTNIGSKVFDDKDMESAYRKAMDIADQDHVKLTEFPEVA